MIIRASIVQEYARERVPIFPATRHAPQGSQVIYKFWIGVISDFLKEYFFESTILIRGRF
jgi:hypothetical protein